MKSPKSPIAEDIARLSAARHHDPGAVLGRHAIRGGVAARSLVPGASRVELTDAGEPMVRIGTSDVYQWQGPAAKLPSRFRITWWDRAGTPRTCHEPYCFPPQVSDFDLHLFAEGKH
ncbi:MAG: GlgB N-terminal domain-containing protein, partial [Gammaproteobacteria bacterium]